VITRNLIERAVELVPLSVVAQLSGLEQRLRADLHIDGVLLTRSEEGMTLFDVRGALHVAAQARQVFDVTGAGDTVIATFTLALASGASFADAARLANYAGGLVVMKRGTATVSATELEHAIRQD
jgi:rfaE bifunctional protein kinase chain/domain